MKKLKNYFFLVFFLSISPTSLYAASTYNDYYLWLQVKQSAQFSQAKSLTHHDAFNSGIYLDLYIQMRESLDDSPFKIYILDIRNESTVDLPAERYFFRDYTFLKNNKNDALLIINFADGVRSKLISLPNMHTIIKGNNFVNCGFFLGETGVSIDKRFYFKDKQKHPISLKTDNFVLGDAENILFYKDSITKAVFSIPPRPTIQSKRKIDLPGKQAKRPRIEDEKQINFDDSAFPSATDYELDTWNFMMEQPSLQSDDLLQAIDHYQN